MTGGRCRTLSELPEDALEILSEARRGVLVTIDSGNRPHAVPVCYVIRNGEIVTPIDAKPKNRRPLGRRKNIEANPAATFLVDRWSEEWSHLGWIMARGTARVEPAAPIVEELGARYPQYREVDPGTEAIVITPDDIAWWLWG
jgi:PPOX class probable F420-dependent enzyme